MRRAMHLISMLPSILEPGIYLRTPIYLRVDWILCRSFTVRGGASASW
jgi:hypothetical protein